MRRDRLIVAAFFAAGLAVMATLYVVTKPTPAPVIAENSGENAPGPYLVIDVEGEATGTITIDLFEHLAPAHVAQITTLAREGAYDNVVFHRVIEGFMAQTGDVQFGKMGGDMRRAGMGGSNKSDLPAEFSDERFLRGIVGMARSQSPDSANSQFFIMFRDGEFLNNNYTIVGEVTDGMDVVDAIKRGHPQSGAISGTPDVMVKVSVTE